MNAFKGIGGEYEVQRLLGGIGTLMYIFTAPALVWFRVIPNVSLTEFSFAYPAGLAACVGATAGAIALKDRNVAVAKVTQETGAAPGLAAAAPTGVQAVKIVNTLAQPVPVEGA